MISFLTVFLRLLRGLWNGFKIPEFRALALVLAGLLLTGTIFYSRIEHWKPLDALYFCVVMLATVGFGDLTPKTDLGKAFTILYIFVGVGILASFITLLATYSQKKRD